MLTRNGGSNFAPRIGESPICQPPPVTTRSPHMFDESLGAEADFTAHIDADLRGSTHRGSYVPIINRLRSFAMSPTVSSGGLFPMVNHAYLCLDVGTRSIRHQIIDFCLFNANVPTNGAISLNLLVVVNIEVVGDRSIVVCRFFSCLYRSRNPEYHLCCAGGKFYIRPITDPPAFIQQLLGNSHFMENIRAYNLMFAMTSFGAKVDESVKRGMGPYVFKISGHIYHWIGSLCLEDGWMHLD
nr:helitron helicase-like domain-containing protein [Tanacetum cinerariifolium]